MADRTILHSDLNSFYASVEIRNNPTLADKPVAVGGDEQARHGIVLAANPLAKQYGIRTAETLWSARRKCPDLVIVPTHFDEYHRFSQAVRQIYLDYTSQIEPMSLDEAFLDVTGSRELFGDGETIAQTIRTRVKEELGLTVSIGVSFNKIFAKLGSDYKKPDAVTIFSRENYQELVWPQPVGNLLYVGKATAAKLAGIGIHTIGELAAADPAALQMLLGRMGPTLHDYANGRDETPVAEYVNREQAKSIGNMITAPRDIRTPADADLVLWPLCENVAHRLRRHGMCAGSVSLYIRDIQLVTHTRQCQLTPPTWLARELMEHARGLLARHYKWKLPIRTLGVTAGDLVPADQVSLQLDLDGTAEKRDKFERIERAMDGLKDRYGSAAVRRGTELLDPKLSGFHPHDHD
ncbi:DNA polymerase IV [Butyricicoccus pullicaecorum]|uniref:DNA polymerase IV n=1 Tax=Butyricicoccus pullicaecorum TaxID=501571 RepID=UPI0039909EA1